MNLKRPSVMLTSGLLVLLALTVATAVVAMRSVYLAIDPISIHGRPISISPVMRGYRPTLLAVGNTRGEHVLYPSADYDLIHRISAQLPGDALTVNDAAVRMRDGNGIVRLWLRTADGNVTVVDRRAARNGLGTAFWMLIVTGLFGGGVGLWIAVLRPSLPAAVAVGTSGLGLMLAAYPVAIIVNSELLLGGSSWLNLMRINYIGIQLFAGSIALVFAVYPARLIPLRLALVGMLALLAAMTAVAFVRYDLPQRFADHTKIVLIDLVMIVGLAIWQWRRSRLDPLGRAYLRLVGATTVLALGGWVATTLGPQVYGGEPLLNVASGSLLMVPIYAAIAVGVVRGNMFDVNRWAWTLLASAVTLLAIFMVEAALVVTYGLNQGPATSVAFLVVGVGWLVARHRFFDRLMGVNRPDPMEVLGKAHTIVLAASPDEQFERWRDALENVFQPLESRLDAGPASPAAVVGDQGLVMHVPAPTFGKPLLLRSAQRGRALFNRSDCALVNQLMIMCDKIDDERLAYDRGMREERQRIAKDLHDDVSGRLLTILHRDDVTLARADVRTALADIRSIVSGLEGQRLSLAAVFADLRRECNDRLAAAGIELAWDGDLTVQLPAKLVDYAVYRALNSIVRELTTNVIRHSRARRMMIAVRFDESRNVLSIEGSDDGVGLSQAGSGRGMRNIAARAQALSGAVSFADSGGTSVSVYLSLDLPRSGDVVPV